MVVGFFLVEDKITHAVEQGSETVAYLVENGYLMERRMVGAKRVYEVNTKEHN